MAAVTFAGRRCRRTASRAAATFTAAVVVSSLLTGIPSLPGAPRPQPAAAAPTTGRLCSGVQASGTFTRPDEQLDYHLVVPAGATATIQGSLDVVANAGGLPEANFYVKNNFTGDYFAFVGPIHSGTYGFPFGGGSWSNGTGAAQDILINVYNNLTIMMNWRFVFTVTGGNATGPCTPMNPKETMGRNCAERNSGSAQGIHADPVDSATGNFDESFDDFLVPGRGPALALDHSYNSLQASADGPLGFGWTHSYAMSATEDPTSHVVTVAQEGGAQISFYPSAGGYEAPPRVVASLTKNPDSSYTMTRCARQTLSFSAGGKLTKITDRNGYSTTLAYAGANLSTVSDSASPARSLHFNWTGTHVTSVTDDTGRAVTFGYHDGAGNLTDYVDAAGASWGFTYTDHRLTMVRRPRQVRAVIPLVTTNVYDAQNRVTSQTDELGRQTVFDYSGLNSAGTGSVKVTDPKGNAVSESYQGYVLTAVTHGFGTPAASVWAFETDASLGLTKVTDPLGRVSVATYDFDGNLRSLRDAQNHLTSATYNGFDEPVTVTDANNVTTTYAYDPGGNVLSQSTPVNGQTRLVRYGYDPAHPGDLTTVTDPVGKVWARAYDPSTGYRLSEADPLGGTTLYGYNTGRGWLTSAVSPRGQAAGVVAGCTPPATGCTALAYDAAGRLTTTTDGDGHQATAHFDSDGNLDYRIDGDGNRTNFVYDTADQLSTVQRADNTTLLTHYWPDGSVKDTVDGAAKTTAYAYDAQGRLSSTTDPDQRATAYGYDPAGNVVSKADPGGTCPAWSASWPPTLSNTARCTAVAYDAANRAVSVTYSDGVTPNVSAIGYDNVGRRTSMTDGTGSSTWAWDALGRLTSARNGAGNTVAYAYANTRDPATTITYPGRGDVARAFDDAGRLVSVGDWLGNLSTFSPDRDSNVATASSPGGTGLNDSYSPFDNADLLNGIGAKANGTTLGTFSYGRDGNGQVTSVATTGLPDNHSYGYTKLNQLQSVDNVPVYSYDAADNITAMGGFTLGGYDAANQLGTATRPTGATTFGFDSRGNRTSASPSVGARTNSTYDQANRLASVDTTTYSPQISPGFYHSLAARSDGSVLSWGNNSNGQLGDGTQTNHSAPAVVPSLGGVTAVSGGAYESAALKADGTVWMSGWNSVGQLGDATTVDRWTPVQVAGLSGVTAVSTESSHTLALRSDGTVWAWGYNGYGELGNNSTADSPLPVAVQGLTNVIAISAGYAHSAALKADGTVWTWGYNGGGQLGNNSTVDSHIPVQVAGLSGVAAIASGYNQVLALKGDGTLWAWGYNSNGQLGDNTTTQRNLPVQVSSLSGVTAVEADGYSSFARKADGSVYSWGYNADGQLADGTTTERHLPHLVTSLAGVTALSMGPVHGLALAADGTAKAWGNNGNGALGFASPALYPSPVAVPTYNRGTSPKASYSYDGDGLRTRKTVAGVASSFTWDSSGGMPLLLDDGATAYLYGPDGLAFEEVSGSTVTWVHHDQLGSTRMLTNASGAVTGTATYDPYGRLTASIGSVGRLGYAGEYTDAETGFVYLRARYYDPATGQFTSVDPAYPQSGSRYGYVGGNPLNGTDPLGLFTIPGTNICVDIGDPNCRSIKDQHQAGAQHVANFAGGVLNAVTFGQEKRITRALGVSDHVNRCSGAYALGEVAGVVLMVALAPGSGEAVDAERGALAVEESAAANAAASSEAVQATLSGLDAGRSAGVRVVGTAEELDDLFAGLSSGGTPIESAYPGKLVELPDGTTVGLRGTSASGGPTIDIKLPTGEILKVHVDPWPG